MIPDLRLHHIGQAVPQIPLAAANYLQRFGYTLASPIIHDPLQTAHVQFLLLPNQPTFLELVAPDGPSSKLTNAIKRGGGLNHLCYTTANLEQTIAHLESTGLKLISDPKPGRAFANRRICWLLGTDPIPIELIERQTPHDPCHPTPPETPIHPNKPVSS